MGRPAYDRRMKRLPSAIALTMMFVAPAAAQTDNAVLALDAARPVPLAGSAPSDSALAGGTYLVSFSVRNRLGDPLRLRRIAFRIPSGMTLIAPDIDGIDNDRDGAVDEGDEGFTRVDEATSAWRIDETVPSVAPGSSLDRAVVVRLSDASEAGSSTGVTVIAAGSVADATLRAEQIVSFSLAPPVLSATLNGRPGEMRFAAGDKPELRVVAEIPSGRVSDIGLSVKGSPAIAGYDTPRAVIGKGLACEGSSDPVIDARKLVAVFGTCQVIAGSAGSEQFVAVEATARLRDADPFADPDVIKAHRTVRLAGAITSDDDILGEPVAVSGGLTGPLIGARLLSVSDDAVDAGDAVQADFRVVNRGDRGATDLRLVVADDALFDCKSVALDDSDAGVDACETGLRFGDMAAGTQRDVTVRARLREDAIIDGEAALRLTLETDGSYAASFPKAAFERRMPSPPTISVVSNGDWITANDVMTARIGDTGEISISGHLPEGRYPASLRFLSRVVDAQTGDQIAPAPLDVEQFAASATGGAKLANETAPLSSDTVDGWTAVTLPLGLVTVPVAKQAAVPGYTARAMISLRDLPEIQVGRLIEVVAELNLYGDRDSRTEDWIEVLIAEPALDLTLRSPDVDRTIDLHDSVPIAVLSCNQGNSGAEAIILTAHLPEGLLPDPTVKPWIRTIQAERADDIVALFATDAKPAGTTHFDPAERVLRGAFAEDQVLEPDVCLALIFQARRSDAFMPNTPSGVVKATVEPYTGRGGSRGRVYPGVDHGEIRFDLPPILFGPVSEHALSPDGNVVHEVSLEIPEAAGPHRVDLSTESSSGLDWTILRLGEDGAALPWRNGTTLRGGEVVTFRLETQSPDAQPLGWIDTTHVRALAFSDAGAPVAVTTRLITRRAEAPGGRIQVAKTMALDSDCDGNLDDERIQDALFEPVKDASPGDCVKFKIAFKHSGDKSMERIVVRDRVPSGTELRPDAVEILREPDSLHSSEIAMPDGGSPDVVWTFEGLFEPGAEGIVSYAVKVSPLPL